MSFMGRAFGARDRRHGNAPPPLEKVLADLHEGEQEIAEAVTAPTTSPATPASSAQDHRARLENLLRDAARIAQLLEQEAAEAALAENLQLDEKRAAVAKLA